MYAALAEELDRADKNDDVSVMLVHGAGDSSTVGNDMRISSAILRGPARARRLDSPMRSYA